MPASRNLDFYEITGTTEILGGNGKWIRVRTYRGDDSNAAALRDALESSVMTGQIYRAQMTVTLAVYEP